MIKLGCDKSGDRRILLVDNQFLNITVKHVILLKRKTRLVIIECAGNIL